MDDAFPFRGKAPSHVMRGSSFASCKLGEGALLSFALLPSRVSIFPRTHSDGIFRVSSRTYAVKMSPLISSCQIRKTCWNHWRWPFWLDQHDRDNEPIWIDDRWDGDESLWTAPTTAVSRNYRRSVRPAPTTAAAIWDDWRTVWTDSTTTARADDWDELVWSDSEQYRGYRAVWTDAEHGWRAVRVDDSATSATADRRSVRAAAATPTTAAIYRNRTLWEHQYRRRTIWEYQ